MGESSFWYRPTRVVPDQRPLNGRCCCCCKTDRPAHRESEKHVQATITLFTHFSRWLCGIFTASFSGRSSRSGSSIITFTREVRVSANIYDVNKRCTHRRDMLKLLSQKINLTHVYITLFLTDMPVLTLKLLIKRAYTL